MATRVAILFLTFNACKVMTMADMYGRIICEVITKANNYGRSVIFVTSQPSSALHS